MSTFDLSKWPSLANAIDTDIESHDGREQKLLVAITSSPSLPEFKNNPTKLLAAIDDFSLNEDFLISVGPQKAGILSAMIEEHQPRVVVELGGYLGYSAILFAAAMKQANGGSSSGLQLYSLELSPEFAAIATHFIALAGLSDIAKVIVGLADSSLERLVGDGEVKEVDLLFLDHAEELYSKDFGIVEGLGLLKKRGALVVADNLVRPGAPDYRALMRAKQDWESKGVRGLIWPGELEDEFEVSTFVGSPSSSA